MRLPYDGVNCPWCHRTNHYRRPAWPLCTECGHRVDRLKILCDCPYCRSCTLDRLKTVIPWHPARRGSYVESERQARSCESARNPHCVCRCKGKMHGTKRDLDAMIDANQLPANDPHNWDPDNLQLHLDLIGAGCSRPAKEGETYVIA